MMPMICASGAVCEKRNAQRARLVAREIFDAHELEALAEREAVLFDRPPQRRIGRIVDHENAFEIGIIEPRHRIEARLEHVGRLATGRDVDRDFRRKRLRRERRRIGQPPRRAAKRDCRDLFQPRQRDGDQRHKENNAKPQRERGAGHEVMAFPKRDDGGEPGADRIGGGCQHKRWGGAGAGERQDRQR